MKPVNIFTHAIHSQFTVSIFQTMVGSYTYILEINGNPVNELKTLSSYQDCVVSANNFIEGYVASASTSVSAIQNNAKKTLIHVNQHVIKANKKDGVSNPPLTAKTYNTNTYASEIEIKGDCKLLYSPDKPLSCGATVWIETHGEVIIIR